MLSLPGSLPGNRRDDTATVDPTDIRGLATACPGYVTERSRSKLLQTLPLPAYRSVRMAESIRIRRSNLGSVSRFL